jgi:hypothetical protein
MLKNILFVFSFVITACTITVSSQTFQQVQKLTVESENNRNTAKSIGISGNYVFFSAGEDNNGEVHVYRKDGASDWKSSQIITSPSNMVFDFGARIKVNDSLLIIGCSHKLHIDSIFGEIGQPAFYSYILSKSGLWTFSQEVVFSDGNKPSSLLVSSFELADSNMIFTLYPSEKSSQLSGKHNYDVVAYKINAQNQLSLDTVFIGTNVGPKYYGYAVGVGVSNEDLVIFSRIDWTEILTARNLEVQFFRRDSNQNWQLYQTEIMQQSDATEEYSHHRPVTVTDSVVYIGRSSRTFHDGYIDVYEKQSSGQWNLKNSFSNNNVGGFNSWYGTQIEVDDSILLTGFTGEGIYVYNTNNIGSKTDVVIPPYKEAQGVTQDEIDFAVSGNYIVFGLPNGRYGGATFIFSKGGVRGRVFNDINKDCQEIALAIGIEGAVGVVTPGNNVVQTNSEGEWYVEGLKPGSYTVIFDTNSNLSSSCNVQQNFIISSNDIVT